MKLYTGTYWKDWTLKIQFRNYAKQFIAVKLPEPHKNCYHTADAYFKEIVGVLLVPLLPITAANTSIMDLCRCRAFGLCELLDVKLLMLWCRSFWGHSRDVVGGIFAYKGSQLFDYGWIWLHSPWNIYDARPEIADAPLMLIFRMGQRACCLHF